MLLQSQCLARPALSAFDRRHTGSASPSVKGGFVSGEVSAEGSFPSLTLLSVSTGSLIFDITHFEMLKTDFKDNYLPPPPSFRPFWQNCACTNVPTTQVTFCGCKGRRDHFICKGQAWQLCKYRHTELERTSPPNQAPNLLLGSHA